MKHSLISHYLSEDEQYIDEIIHVRFGQYLEKKEVLATLPCSTIELTYTDMAFPDKILSRLQATKK